MSKPLNENLNAVRIETEDGDLIPVMEYAGQKFSDLIHREKGYSDFRVERE